MEDYSLVIIVLLVAAIIYTLIYAYVFLEEIKLCETSQSPFCYTIACPCDNESNAPCFGYASRPGPSPNTFYCSIAPQQLVDSNGKAI
jgi:hypothetical protein